MVVNMMASAWCQAFDANFGAVLLSALTTAPPDTTTTTTTSTVEVTLDNISPTPLSSCVTLMPEVLNLMWRLDGDFVVFRIDTSLPVGSWVAVGVPDPALGFPSMVGADVTVVGILESSAFAIDYYMESRSQCNYAGDRVSESVLCWEFEIETYCRHRVFAQTRRITCGFLTSRLLLD